MFNHVVVVGCSLTWGDELLDREGRYASLLSKHYNATLHDFSKNGNSNEIISTSLINNTSILLANKAITPENTLVVVQWSHKERLHYYSRSGTYHKISPHTMMSANIKISNKHGVHRHIVDDYIDTIDLKMYYENHSTTPFTVYNSISKIHHAQSFLQYNKLKYIFIFATKRDQLALNLSRDDLRLLRTGGRDEDKLSDSTKKYLLPDVSGMLESIDTKKIYKHPFLDYCKVNNYKPAIGGHPREDAHLSYSKQLINFIGDLYD